jgi:hypothetical protein
MDQYGDDQQQNEYGYDDQQNDGGDDDQQPAGPPPARGRARGRGRGAPPAAPEPAPRGRVRIAPRNLPRRIIRNCNLMGMPKTTDENGQEQYYESDDGEEFNDPIDENALLAPEEELLVDRNQRAIIFPFHDAE